jgi:hypothetical protein
LVLIQWQTVKLVPGSNTAYKVRIAVFYRLDGLVESSSRVCRSSLRRLLSRRSVPGCPSASCQAGRGFTDRYFQPSGKATAQACVDRNSWYFGELYRNV